MRMKEVSTRYHYLMLCNQAELSQKFIPEDLQPVEETINIISRDYQVFFTMADFLWKLFSDKPDLPNFEETFKSTPEKICEFKDGEKVQIEGKLLLPCLLARNSKPM